MKWIFPLLLIGALLGGLWYISEGGGSEGGLDQEERVTSIGPDGAVTTQLTSPDGSDSGDSGTRVAATQARAPLGDDGKTQAAYIPTKVSVQPKLIRSNQPMADVQVWLLDRSQLPAVEWQAAQRDPAAWEEYVKRKGVEQRTAENGVASFSLSTNFAVFAQGDGHVGQSEHIGPLSAPLQVTMKPLVDLEVLVQTAGGLPGVSVPVAVYVESGSGEQTVITRYTMANGKVQFRQLAGVLKAHANARQFSVGLAFPVRRLELVPFDPNNFPTQPLKLLMPPAAPVVIRALDANRQPISQRMSISVGRRILDPGSASEVFRPFDTRRTQNGETRLPYAELGAELHMRFTGVRNLSDLEETRPGPSVPDQTHEVEVVWDLPLPTVSGIAMDSSGNTLGGRRGRFQMESGGAVFNGPGFMCDDQGRFEMIVRHAWTAGSERIARIEIFGTPNSAPLEGTMDLSFEVPPGLTEYGRVTFVTQPLLVTGTVIDPSGAPVAGAHVRVEGGSGESWKVLPGLSASTKADGVFQIHGTDPGINLRVVARRRSFAESTVDFQFGAKGISVPLVPGELPDEGSGDKDAMFEGAGGKDDY